MQTGRSKDLDLRLGNYFDDSSISNVSLLLYFHSFEHIRDIKYELRQAYNVLDDGGYILFVMPGILNILTSNMGNILEKIQNTHLFYFDLDNLIDICSQFGFNFAAGNDSIYALFKKEKSVISNIFYGKNHIKIPRYMRHDHKIMYLNVVNKIYKLNSNKDLSIIIDILLRNTNPYTGKVMLEIDAIKNILGKRRVFIDSALNILSLFFEVKTNNKYI